MRVEDKATATPTLAEQLGVEYREVDGLYYPDWSSSDTDNFATVGKYGHRWMRMLMEHDRYLYNQYFLDGTLIIKAKDYENYCWELHDSMIEKLKKSREAYCDTSDSMWMIWRIQELEITVDEIINSDLYETIDYNKKLRFAQAKETKMQETK